MSLNVSVKAPLLFDRLAVTYVRQVYSTERWDEIHQVESLNRNIIDGVLGKKSDPSLGFVPFCDAALEANVELKRFVDYEKFWPQRYLMLQDRFVEALISKSHDVQAIQMRGTSASTILMPSEREMYCQTLARNVAQLVLSEFAKCLPKSFIREKESIYVLAIKKIEELYVQEGRKAARFLVDHAFAKWEENVSAYRDVSHLVKEVMNQLKSKFFDISDSLIVINAFEQQVKDRERVFFSKKSLEPPYTQESFDDFFNDFLHSRWLLIEFHWSSLDDLFNQFPVGYIWDRFQADCKKFFGTDVYFDETDRDVFRSKYLEFFAKRWVACQGLRLPNADLTNGRIPYLILQDDQVVIANLIVSKLKLAYLYEFFEDPHVDLNKIVEKELDDLYRSMIWDTINCVSMSILLFHLGTEENIKSGLVDLGDPFGNDEERLRSKQNVDGVWQRILLTCSRGDLLPPKAEIIAVIERNLLRAITAARNVLLVFEQTIKKPVRHLSV
ncbi:MAG: hypothetical protein HW387_1054 [Parachlamydiales bacterium]|nr:hypothetical protein [Parachlamydiales bacterium]